MNVANFLFELRRRDIRVWAEAEQLRCAARSGALTPELRSQLHDHKSEIIEFLCKASSLATQPAAIVPLRRSGARIPVFAVAGHNGDVFCYRALTRHLGEDQPFFGLQPPGFNDDLEPFTGVEELAAYFASAIRAIHPRGPCIIAGYCAGGTVAYELARQLLHDGIPVSFVALFGSPFPSAYRLHRRLFHGLAGQIRRIRKHVGDLATHSAHAWWTRAAEKLRDRAARRAAKQADARDPALQARAKVERATLAAVRRYQPSRFAVRVHLFLPSPDWGQRDFIPLRWRSFARRGEEFHGREGCDGDNMLREPHVAVFAEQFRLCYEKTLSEAAS